MALLKRNDYGTELMKNNAQSRRAGAGEVRLGQMGMCVAAFYSSLNRTA